MHVADVVFWAMIATAGILFVMSMVSVPIDWWQTRDQQAMTLMDSKQYSEAAEMFEDPVWQGIALYRDGQFERAASAFAREDSPIGAFNRGNALLMSGKYDASIVAYDRALQLKPGWDAAQQNRDIAIARRDRLTPDETEGGTGGELGADEIVFDDRAKNSSESTEIDVSKGDELSDQSLRALWLQRVETRPADFLKIKFAYQASKEQTAADESQGGGKQ